MSLYFYFCYLMIDLFGVCFYIQYFFNVVKNKLLELIKRRSKVQQNKMSSERALNFDQ